MCNSALRIYLHMGIYLHIFRIFIYSLRIYLYMLSVFEIRGLYLSGKRDAREIQGQSAEGTNPLYQGTIQFWLILGL